MKYGFITPNFGYCADVRVLADLAHEAEGGGWDGFFIWDHLQFGDVASGADPGVALTAMAMERSGFAWAAGHARASTHRQARPRDRDARPSLEWASRAGSRSRLAAAPEYTAFGDEGDPKTRAAKLDEGLEVLTGLWSGRPVNHQEPTIGSGARPRAARAAAAHPGVDRRYVARQEATASCGPLDGVAPIVPNIHEGQRIDPSDFRDLVGYIEQQRTSSEPFDVVQFGQTKGAGDTATVGAYAEAGATWWLDAAWPTLEATRERLRKGPPRL